MSQKLNEIYLELKKIGVDVGILNAPFIKPLDENQLINISKKQIFYLLLRIIINMVD